MLVKCDWCSCLRFFWPPCVSINVQHVSLLLHVSVDTASGELQVGDRIIEVNGEPVEDKSLAEVSAFHAALSKAVSTLFTAQMTWQVPKCADFVSDKKMLTVDEWNAPLGQLEMLS